MPYAPSDGATIPLQKPADSRPVAFNKKISHPCGTLRVACYPNGLRFKVRGARSSGRESRSEVQKLDNLFFGVH
jgi:hypothetical protein